MRLCLHRVGVPSGMKVEHLRMWNRKPKREEDHDPGNWDKFVALIYAAFRGGELAAPCACQAVVMIPRVGGTYFRVIGLVGVIWKEISGIIYCRLSSSIHFHDVLHGFRAARGTGTVTLEAKLLQDIISMREMALHSIFLDLRKSYYDLDRDRCLYTLEGYNMGPMKIRILWTYWARLHMAANVGGHYGPAFQSQRGVTQGDLFSHTIFNVVVDAIIRHWLTVVGVPQEGAGK